MPLTDLVSAPCFQPLRYVSQRVTDASSENPRTQRVCRGANVGRKMRRMKPRPAAILTWPHSERPQPDFCYHSPYLIADSPGNSFRHVANSDEQPPLMYHLPTKAVFEIVTDGSQSALGGLPVFGFAVRLLYVCQGGKITDDTKELAIIGHQGDGRLSQPRDLSLRCIARPKS
jgi:hypothetical protein